MSGSTSDASRRESFIERASLILITAAIGGVLVLTVNWVCPNSVLTNRLSKTISGCVIRGYSRRM